MDRFGKKYLIGLLVITALLAGLVGGYNMLVDPYNAYPAVHLSALNDARHSLAYVRGRVESYQRNRWETLLMGSSIMEVGYDAGHASLDGQNAANVALNGNAMFEVTQALKYLIDMGHPVKRVVLNYDNHWFWFHKDQPRGYRESLLNPDYSWVDYHASNILGFGSIENSNNVVQRWLDDGAPAYNAGGQRVKPIVSEGRSQANAFARVHYDRPEEESYRLQAESLAYLKDFLSICREQGISVKIVLSPVHVSYFEMMDEDGLWPIWEAGKRRLVEMVQDLAEEQENWDVEIWDFAGVNEYTTERVPAYEDRETRMKYFWDPLHMTGDLGDMLLARIHDQSLDSKGVAGVRIDSQAKLDSQMMRVRGEYERWEKRKHKTKE
ncbi:hypothetical protein KS4_19810 [Poriferisphaera corsica]|uniref:Uncharacterized protein n=1 Tax=Poriferisphaera corsica TaxID=2528020 RepID=A0A517YUM2_9BACT|nr:hypothetical protein [Poriferisphaera corsica]QDU33921.1 hypothetical protein KS4_19810 [Poriferisphaera corsica]